MKNFSQAIIIIASFLFVINCERNDVKPDKIRLLLIKIDNTYLSPSETKKDLPIDKSIIIKFETVIDTNTVNKSILLQKSSNSSTISGNFSFENDNRTIILTPLQNLLNNTEYTIKVTKELRGKNHETFPGIEYRFSTINGVLTVDSIRLNGVLFNSSVPLRDVDFSNIKVDILFSDPLDEANYQSFFVFTGFTSPTYTLLNGNRKLSITYTGKLDYYKRYFFNISSNLTSKNGFPFNGFSGSFYTALDSTDKFPRISDNELLTLVQRQTFKYFWDYAHPVSGLTRERYGSGETVTSGGSGFGLMTIPVGIERGFITRTEGVERINKVVDFLTAADRFHGAWSHWLNGSTGKVIPFSTNDNGGDLVETSYMAQGLLTVRQYLNPADSYESSIIDKINTLLNSIEWSWYTRGGQNVLYWHWSPTADWAMNMQVRGYNEALITYFMAATSTAYPISASVYHNGWANNGGIINGKTFYGITLPVGYDYGGPLFFAHYSFLGLNPTNLHDQYANYWQQNVNHTLINRQHCINNPRTNVGYSADCWGLTASDEPNGYGVHEPTRDPGVISPTAAISSIPYTPEYSMKVIRHFYYLLGDKLWGDYGFYDAFSINSGWWASSYLAIDQGPIIIMIENYRTGLCWNLFMSAPEVQQAMNKLGFSNN